MLLTEHPEVLANDWLPPVAIGRQREVLEVVRRLDPPRPAAPPPWSVGIAGPSGSGTSVVARRAAREVVDRWRASGRREVLRVLSVRAAGARGAHGVVSELLRRLDEGFDGRGFTVSEVLAGLLRRLRRDGQPSVVVVDDLSIAGPDLAPILAAVGDPDRFLPEGEHGMPPVWMIVAGTVEALRTLDGKLPGRCAIAPWVALDPYPPETLTAIVRDRAERTLGRPLPSEAISELVRRSVIDGGGARRAIDLLRRTILGSSMACRPRRAGRFVAEVAVEPRVVRAIGEASRGIAARLSDVRRVEAEIARSQGTRPLPTTTLWRRIVRLEQAGYVRREIRTGGDGGTLSLVRVLTPIDEWVTADRHPGTLRVAAPWDDARSVREGGPAAPPPPTAAWTPADGGPG